VNPFGAKTSKFFGCRDRVAIRGFCSRFSLCQSNRFAVCDINGGEKDKLGGRRNAHYGVEFALGYVGDVSVRGCAIGSIDSLTHGALPDATHLL